MSALAGIGLTGLPPITPAQLPANIRGGDAAAKRAYTEALGFEQVLVNEVAQQLGETVSSPDGSASSGMLGGGSDTNGLASLLPQAMTSAIMTSGGLGIASEIARSLDPALAGPARTGGAASTSAGAGGVAP